MNNRKKRIAITLRIVSPSNYSERRDALSLEWPTLLEQVEGVPILIPNSLRDVQEFLCAVEPDGLILSGGDNYGDDEERDRTERAVFSFALARGIPTVGICRGMQVINLLLGGNIQYNVGREHVNTHHSVEIVDEAFVRICGHTMIVNSYHNNAIRPDDLAPALRIFASCPDGTVEGVFHASHPIAGMMWHPERQPKSTDLDLLRALFDKERFWSR